MTTECFCCECCGCDCAPPVKYYTCQTKGEYKMQKLVEETWGPRIIASLKGASLYRDNQS